MNKAFEDKAAVALDDARCRLTRAYAANDPEMREIVRVVGSTLLPDRAVFEAALRQFRERCFRYGRTAAITGFSLSEHGDAWDELGKDVHVLIALVYGDDDAQAGEVGP